MIQEIHGKMKAIPLLQFGVGKKKSAPLFCLLDRCQNSETFSELSSLMVPLSPSPSKQGRGNLESVR